MHVKSEPGMYALDDDGRTTVTRQKVERPETCGTVRGGRLCADKKWGDQGRVRMFQTEAKPSAEKLRRNAFVKSEDDKAVRVIGMVGVCLDVDGLTWILGADTYRKEVINNGIDETCAVRGRRCHDGY